MQIHNERLMTFHLCTSLLTSTKHVEKAHSSQVADWWHLPRNQVSRPPRQPMTRTPGPHLPELGVYLLRSTFRQSLLTSRNHDTSKKSTWKSRGSRCIPSMVMILKKSPPIKGKFKLSSTASYCPSRQNFPSLNPMSLNKPGGIVGQVVHPRATSSDQAQKRHRDSTVSTEDFIEISSDEDDLQPPQKKALTKRGKLLSAESDYEAELFDKQQEIEKLKTVRRRRHNDHSQV
jgi:hypothetical protein